jgi:hypothetical protein
MKKIPHAKDCACLECEIQKEFPALESVEGSTFCRFSVIENKLAILYRNQERIYGILKIIRGNQIHDRRL